MTGEMKEALKALALAAILIAFGCAAGLLGANELGVMN
jgi:hypothetical protein